MVNFVGYINPTVVRAEIKASALSEPVRLPLCNEFFINCTSFVALASEFKILIMEAICCGCWLTHRRRCMVARGNTSIILFLFPKVGGLMPESKKLCQDFGLILKFVLIE